MKKHGWLKNKDIDVVKMADGTLISVDNKRVLAASRAGIDVRAKVRFGDEKLSSEMAIRFTTREGTPTTWGEAIRFRINNQKKLYRETYPNGSYVTGSTH